MHSDDQTKIDPLTASLKVVHTDLVLPGNGGMDIVVNRSLRSFGRGHWRNLGIGWDIHFGRLLGRSFCEGKAYKRRLVLSDTQSLVFFRWDKAPSTYITRERWRGLCVNGTTSVVIAPDGTRYTFGKVLHNGHREVSEVRDVNGNWLRFSYHNISGDRRCEQRDPQRLNRFLAPATVTSSDGRRLDFTVTMVPRGQCTTQVSRPKVITAMTFRDSVTGQTRIYRYKYTHIFPTRGGHWLRIGTELRRPYLTRAEDPELGRVWRFSACQLLGATRIYPQGYECDWRLEITQPEGGVSRFYFNKYRPNGSYTKYFETTRKTRGGASWTITRTTDYTKVRGPVRETIYYFSSPENVSQGSAWLSGTIKRVLTRTLSGATVEDRQYSWAKQKISNDDLTVKLSVGSSLSKSDTDTHAPLLRQLKVIRDGTTYTSNYGSHNSYGDPRAQSESGPAGSRSSSTAYWANQSKWIVRGKVVRRVVAGVETDYNQYDSRGRVTLSRKLGRTSTFGYTSQGDLYWKRDPRGYTTYFADYFRGIPRRVRTPDNALTQRTVNSSGMIIRQTDPLNRTTIVSYDRSMRPTRINFPGSYYADSAVSYPNTRTTVVARGGLTVREYRDLYGRVDRVSRSTGSTTVWRSFGYDALDRKTFASMPYFSGQSSSARMRFAYDLLDRVTRTTHADGRSRTVSYLSGARVRQTDEDGQVTTRYFQRYGSPEKGAVKRIDSPNGVRLYIDRNALGTIYRVRSLLPSGATINRTKTLNAKQEVTASSDPEVGYATYAYDAAGNLTAKNVAGLTTRYVYDAMGRPTRVSHPGHGGYGGYSDSFAYNLKGQMLRAQNPFASRSFAYDSGDKLRSDVLTVDGTTFSTRYSYNPNGALNRVVYPTNRVVDYSTDALGRPTRLTGLISSISYFPSGNPNVIAYHSGVRVAHAEDARDRLRVLHVYRGTDNYAQLHYTYDGRSNVRSLRDTAHAFGGFTPSVRNLDLSYDGNARLRTANSWWGSGTFDHDRQHNITRVTIGSATRGYPLNVTKQLLTAITTTGQTTRGVSHDIRANMTSVDGHLLRFDGADRLRRTQSRGNQTLHYRYDALGRLVRAQHGSQVKYFAFDAGFNLLGQYNADRSILREFFWLRGKLVGNSATVNGGHFGLHTDALGSVIAASWPDGNAMFREAYFPYGARYQGPSGDAVSSVWSTMAPWFTGKMEDPTTGLIYMGRRWYFPIARRFVSLDPAAFSPDNGISFNRYAYANDNPLKYVDPDGAWSIGFGNRNTRTHAGPAIGGSRTFGSGGFGIGGPRLGLRGKRNKQLGGSAREMAAYFHRALGTVKGRAFEPCTRGQCQAISLSTATTFVTGRPTMIGPFSDISTAAWRSRLASAFPNAKSIPADAATIAKARFQVGIYEQSLGPFGRHVFAVVRSHRFSRPMSLDFSMQRFGPIGPNTTMGKAIDTFQPGVLHVLK